MARRQPQPRRRHWTILIVPPQPTGKTHTLRVHARQIRAVAVVALLGFFSYTGWSFLEAMQVSASASQLAEVHQLVLTLNDSLQAAQQRADSALQLAAVTANVAHGPTLITRKSRPTNPVGLSAAAAGVILPVAGTITSRFSQSRWQPILNLFRPHEGVDISAPRGTNIRAPADGRVSFVGHRLGYGQVVEVDHGGGVTTLYAHCQKILVREGDYVAAGAVIAKVGATGLATAPHVHFEVIVNGRHVDPLRYLLQSADPASAAVPSFSAGDHE
ncbi:MAG: M23 family metallopeptidase [Gemmatimonadota bacterium]|nr:M23 family metallopeptidase [Gemmatimonadota bacterium]HEU4988216.1 M23 family metallopeptidase [Gemmatimonadaceae bacterium]